MLVEAVACKAIIVFKMLNAPPCYVIHDYMSLELLDPAESYEVTGIAIQGHLQMYHWVHGTDQASFWQKTG